MFVIFKSLSGCDYPIYNDRGAVERVIKFRGGCYANTISESDFELLKQAYPSFEKAIKDGFIVVNDSQAQVDDAVKESVEEAKSEAVAKQQSTRRKNSQASNVEIAEA